MNKVITSLITVLLVIFVMLMGVPFLQGLFVDWNVQNAISYLEDSFNYIVLGSGSQVPDNLVPSQDNTYNLGSASYRWHDLFIGGNATLPAISGVTSFSATGDLDIGSHNLRAETFTSDVATGTAPFTVSSNTTVTNLSADLLDNYDITDTAGTLGATAWVVASDAPASIIDYASFLHDNGFPVWLCDGVDDHLEIQAAIDALPADGGKVVLSEGTFITSDYILIGQYCKLEGQGVDATTIKLADNIQRTVIEMEDDASIQNLTVDGNEANQRAGEASWTSVDDVPRAYGVMMGEYWANSEVLLAKSRCSVQDVKIKDCLRSNLLPYGDKHYVRNVILDSSYTDHQLYVSGTTKSTIEHLLISGKANSEAVTFGGNAADNLLEDIYIFDLAAGKWFFPSKALIVRDTAGANNRVQNIYIQDTSTTGIEVELNASCHIHGLYVITKGYQNPILDIHGSDVAVSDFEIEATTDDLGGETGYMVRIRDSSRVHLRKGKIVAPAGTYRGILIDAATAAMVDIGLDSLYIDTPDQPIRGNGTVSFELALRLCRFPNSKMVHNTGTWHISTDHMPMSPIIDLSGAATDIEVFHATTPCALVGYAILYTEASSADDGVAIRIGRYQDGVALDDDYFDSVTSEISKNRGYTKWIAGSELANIPIAAGDTITVGTGGGKVGAGEVMIILQIAEMAD